jgi:lipoate-protein ligase A
MIIRFIDSHALPGAFNMACDYVLSNNTQADGEAILRLYAWEHPTISLGFHQKAEDIDWVLCAKGGIEVVRRPTGGRAILHWNEITYSFIFPLSNERGKTLLREIYRKVHSAILYAIRQSGSIIDFSPGRKAGQMRNPLCFASSAGTELEVGGKKVVGSAQRLFDNAILQHGSILLGPEHLKLPFYLKQSEEKKNIIARKLQETSTHLNVTNRSFLKEWLKNCISGEFQSEIVNSNLTKEESQEIKNNLKQFQLSTHFEE